MLPSTFPKKLPRFSNDNSISYYALVGMKGDKHQFPYYYGENKQSLIISCVCERFGTDMEGLKKRTRRRSVVIPRQVCMFLLYRYANLSLKEIGELFGGYDHTSVIYAKNLITDLMETNDEMRDTVRALEVKIQ
jgi:chromosomal replication initiator protein